MRFAPPSPRTLAAGSPPRRRPAGFSLLELMVVVAIIVILALIALPGIPDKVIRDQIVEGMKLTDIAKAPVAASWAVAARLPVNNIEAGLPVPEHIVNNYISSVAVESGAIQVTFGNRANANIRGKVLSLRPGVVEAAPMVPVAWVCGNAEPPNRMTAKGLNKTNIPLQFLPLNCRALGPAAPLG
jgi:type IV pilus assembly protein PilA